MKKQTDPEFISLIKFSDKDSCWEWQGPIMENGYGTAGHHMLAHRRAYKMFKGEIPDGACVLHKCDNRSCCNPFHLFLGTYKDNTADMISKGRSKLAPQTGSANGRSKLTEKDVQAIRALIEQGEKKTEIAKRFGVSAGLVGHIAHGRNWNHV